MCKILDDLKKILLLGFLKTTQVQTAWEPKNATLEFLAGILFTCDNYHKNILCTL